MRVRLWLTMMAALLAGGVAFAGESPAVAAHVHDSGVLLFTAADLAARSDLAADSALKGSDYGVTADVLVSEQQGRLRFLAEALLSSRGGSEIERLQLGWSVSDSTLLWLGRFHQPASAWNTDHHHGAFLQTAITRPGIEHWEDENGLLPQHLLGTLLESRHEVGEHGRGLLLAAGIGAGAVLSEEGLEAVRIIGNPHGGHKASYSARIAYLPDIAGRSSAGLVLAHNEVAVLPAMQAVAGTDILDVRVLGAYADLYGERWRLIAVSYGIRSQTDTELAAATHSFLAAYAQGEFNLSPAMTAFGRIETSAHAAASPLVQLHPDSFALRRGAVGLRRELGRTNAVSIELSRQQTLRDVYGEFRLQWSGVFR